MQFWAQGRKMYKEHAKYNFEHFEFYYSLFYGPPCTFFLICRFQGLINILLDTRYVQSTGVISGLRGPCGGTIRDKRK